jgi:hypothetical protein
MEKSHSARPDEGGEEPAAKPRSDDSSPRNEMTEEKKWKKEGGEEPAAKPRPDESAPPRKEMTEEKKAGKREGRNPRYSAA